jgi:hypothetical protein
VVPALIGLVVWLVASIVLAHALGPMIGRARRTADAREAPSSRQRPAA